MEFVKTFEEVTGVKVPYKIEARREGDIGSMYANCDLAKNDLGWTPKYKLEDMCKLLYLEVIYLHSIFIIFSIF